MKVSYPMDGENNIERPLGTSLRNGFYPIGYYHCWHGGIHIEGIENKTSVKAIADGKIVAFREGTDTEIGVGKNGKKLFVSNSFVLIRHDYKSSEGNTITFYSLYQHLNFGQEPVQKTEESKPQTQENVYTVKAKESEKKQQSGIFSLDNQTFVPLYSEVKMLKENKDNYQISFKGKTVTIPKNKNVNKNVYETLKDNKIVYWGDKQGDKGLLLYSEASTFTLTKGVIKDGEKVTILSKNKDKKEHNWYKVKYQDKEGFISEEHLATKPSDSKQQEEVEKTTKNRKSLPKFLQNLKPKEGIQTCDIEVKAGEFIGYVGKQGLFNDENYCAAHIEVFTPDNMEDFIINKKDDGKNEKFYFELKKGTLLKPYLRESFVALIYYKGTRVEVISKSTTYAKVRPIEDVFIQQVHNWTISEVVGDKAIEKKWLLPEERKTFWIENEYIEAVKGKKEYIFKSGLPHLYLTDPERELKNRSKGRTYEDELAKNVTIDIRQCKEKVSYENKEWIYVKSHYYKGGKTIYNQGWVEVPKEENRFSAYNWKKFGFKTYDAEAHRMYPIKGVNNYEGTSKFIKEMIRLIDGQVKDNKEDGKIQNEELQMIRLIDGQDKDHKKDGKIQNEELQASYNKPELYHTFSRMVCKHKSEWSYKWEKIEEDARAFYKYHHPDAKEKEIKERLDEVKLKYDALYDFWAVLKAKGVFKTDTFWYFEPFGWVEQMKRVFGVLDKNTIYITRKWERWTGANSNSATYGTFVFGEITGFICEPYGPETTKSEQDKRIPVGTYNLEWHPKSGKFPKNVYTKEGRYVTRKKNPFSATYINFPELKNGIIILHNENVSKKRGILLHAGYEGGWTEGCINPFKNLNEKLRDKNIELKESVELLLEIYEKIEEIGIEKVKIVITDEINNPKSKEDENYGEIIKKRPK